MIKCRSPHSRRPVPSRRPAQLERHDHAPHPWVLPEVAELCCTGSFPRHHSNPCHSLRTTHISRRWRRRSSLVRCAETPFSLIETLPSRRQEPEPVITIWVWRSHGSDMANGLPLLDIQRRDGWACLGFIAMLRQGSASRGVPNSTAILHCKNCGKRSLFRSPC